MNQTLLSSFGTSTQRVEHALDALRERPRCDGA